MMIGGNARVVYGTLAVVSADNLEILLLVGSGKAVLPLKCVGTAKLLKKILRQRYVITFTKHS